MRYKPNLKRKILATLVDYTVIFIATVAYATYFGTVQNDGSQSVEGWKCLPLMIFWFLYLIAAEAYYGATVGHKLFNLEVVTASHHNKIRLSQAVKRRLLDPIDIFFYGIPAIITIKNTGKHQRLGDLWAGTIVINTSDPEQKNIENIA